MAGCQGKAHVSLPATPSALSGSSSSSFHLSKGADKAPGLRYDYAQGIPWMVLLALQFGLQPVITRLCSSDFVGKDPVLNPRVMVMCCEGMKIMLSTAIMTLKGDARREHGGVLRLLGSSLSLRGSLLPAVVPALSYSLQNIFLVLSYVTLDPLVANLLNPTKVVWTVFFSWVLVNRKSNLREGAALALLFVVIALLKMDDSAPQESASQRAVVIDPFGFFYATMASLLSGFGAASCEAVMRRYGKSGYQFSLELSMCVFLLALAQTVALLLWCSNYDFLVEACLRKGYHQLVSESVRGSYLGYVDAALDFGKPTGGVPFVRPPSLETHMPSAWQMLPMLVQASGGIMVGKVTEHVGSVAKGFAIVAGIFITAVVNTAVNSRAPTLNLYVSALCICVSICIQASATGSGRKKAAAGGDAEQARKEE